MWDYFREMALRRCSLRLALLAQDRQERIEMAEKLPVIIDNRGENKV